MAISHAAAFDEAFGALLASGRSDFMAANPEAQSRMARGLMGVSWLETQYGYGWRGAGAGSNNMGAITGTYQGQAFQHQDSRPDENGDGQPEVYVTNFRAYPTRHDGWVDLVRVVFRTQAVADAALRGDVRGMSQGLYNAHYYTGTSTVPSVNVDRHEAALTRAVEKASAELGPMPGLVLSDTEQAMGLASQVASSEGLVALGIAAAAGIYFLRRMRKAR